MCRLSCRNYRREREEAICRLSCLSYCGPDGDIERRTSSGVRPHKSVSDIAKTYKVCPKCKHSCIDTRNCLHCGHYMRWASLPALPDLSFFSSNKNATQAGPPIASPDGRWRKFRQNISPRLKTECDHGIQKIVRSCGDCNRSVNYADICNRFCPECGSPLSLTSTALDKYADVVRAGPHQQGRRRIRSVIFNRSGRARRSELGDIEEKETEEDDGIVELEEQFQYPELHPRSMPSFANLASVAQPLAYTDVDAVHNTPPWARASPQSTSSGVISGETLIEPHSQDPGAFCFDSSPPSWRKSEPKTLSSSPPPAMAYKSEIQCQNAFVSERLVVHHSDGDLSKGGPVYENEGHHGDIFCTPSRDARPSSFEVRVIQTLINSLNVEPMAVASAAMLLHKATHRSDNVCGPPAVHQEGEISSSQLHSSQTGTNVALRAADSEVVDIHGAARAARAGYASTEISYQVPVQVHKSQPNCLEGIANVNIKARGQMEEKMCIPATGEVQSPAAENTAWI